MKRFGTFRGIKKHKDPNRGSGRRQSEPRGLYGRKDPQLLSPAIGTCQGGYA